MKSRALLIAAMITLTSCSDGTVNLSVTEEVVVEGFIYSGNPVNSIHISRLIPFISEEEEDFSINDANVLIEWNDTSYLLSPDGNESGAYLYEGNDLQIIDGNTYVLSFEYFGERIVSSTTVPEKPQGLSVSDPRIEIEQINELQDLFERTEIPNIEIYWDNPEGNYYFARVENIESDPEEIVTIDFGDNERNLSFEIEPTNLDVFNVIPFTLTHYGRYQVVLYHVNQEYVDLYESGDQDSRNLSEPPSNVENGLGIFTSFSSDTLIFSIEKG
ncbi:MAG: DUF4249 family protein [Balneola sp.]|nr:MAG: DUF4249 family protein [Balneola sp.]